MAKKKEAKETIGTIVTRDGKKYEVTGENEKYWICKNTQFRKGNQNIAFKPRKGHE